MKSSENAESARRDEHLAASTNNHLTQRTTFFVDFDNTLIDNDAVKSELSTRISVLLGPAGSKLFWECYEDIRSESGKVNIPATSTRTVDKLIAGDAVRPHISDRELRFCLAELFREFPYANFVFDGAADLLTRFRSVGLAVILSEGDAFYQPMKIGKSGLSEVVDAQSVVVDDKIASFSLAAALYPADRYVIVDDKPGVLQAAKEHFANVTTVWIRKGHYANSSPASVEDFVDVTVDEIAELLDRDWLGFQSSSRPQQ